MLAIGVVGAAVLISTLALALAAAVSSGQRIAGAADSAALAGADALVGISTAVPCEAAHRVAEANGVGLDACVADGLVLTVRVVDTVFGIPASAVASAGPPDFARSASVGSRSWRPPSALESASSAHATVQCVSCRFVDRSRSAHSSYKKEPIAREQETRHRRVTRQGEDDRPVLGSRL